MVAKNGAPATRYRALYQLLRQIRRKYDLTAMTPARTSIAIGPPRTRTAKIADAAAIAKIYNQGIADRIATFETEPPSATDIAGWFTGEHLVVVAETGETGLIAFAASFPYSSRPCYRGIGEFSVYVRRDYRGRGAGRAVLAALIEAVTARGMHKLTSGVFPENAASRALLKGLGFEEIGIHRRHGQLDGRWRGCVIVERLLDPGGGE
jgi:L-amino acid N-acyltransferase YncA